MGIASAILKTKGRDLHDGLIKTLAKWDPESVGAAQLEQWDSQAREMARIAAKAATDSGVATEARTNISNNIARYTAAAEKLMAAGNEAAAEKAADEALSWKNKLPDAEAEADEAAKWAVESREAAERAEKIVLEGKSKIEKALRGQEKAKQEAVVAESRRADRERIAGLTHGLSGSDAAIDALVANANSFREKAAADNIRSGVLGKAVESDAEVNAALAEVDGTVKPKTFAEKMAALKG